MGCGVGEKNKVNVGDRGWGGVRDGDGVGDSRGEGRVRTSRSANRPIDRRID